MLWLIGACVAVTEYSSDEVAEPVCVNEHVNWVQHELKSDKAEL